MRADAPRHLAAELALLILTSIDRVGRGLSRDLLVLLGDASLISRHLALIDAALNLTGCGYSG
ncbi:hypothetical protein CVO77_03665 [Sphingopyxis lindanitolerans]|uniref:Uncharacterized protein n=1 Tax=Sphingopyxis lindanitolerans TaxID=2054227 RepID=A0A2S8B5Z9_9SPHN|nr:hypothetical protein CVO77_03665 [Sphingopyxis lindanitolerans]